jgi:enolase-phosphatase E1
MQTEAEAADDAGVHAILVDRPGNAALSTEARERFAVVQRLTDLP